MQNVPAADDSEVYANIERGIGLTNRPTEEPFQPLEYFKEQAAQTLMMSADRKPLDSAFVLNSGFPDLAIGDSKNDMNIFDHNENHTGSGSTLKDGDVSDDSESPDTSEMYCAAVDDGPRNRVDQQLDGPAVVHVPAEAGNAQQIVELISSDNFQNESNTLTAEGMEAIRAAVANTGFFQTYEGRTQEVQNFVNRSLQGQGILLSFDRDRANENTAVGSEPAVVLRIPDLNQPRDRGRDAVYRIPLRR